MIMSRRPLMAGNWKMHKTIAESLELVEKLREGLRAGLEDREALVCPPMTALKSVADALKGSPLAVGAQNMNDHLQGAFTGETSPLMIKDAGATHVILGHSERRQYFGETDAFVNHKAALALEQGLTPIVCVGETLQEREGGKTFSVVETQVKGTLAGFSAEQAVRAVIAYEPVWAIGTGKTATPAQAQEVHALIRGLLKKLFGDAAAGSIRVLYGGSVKADNIDDLMAQPDIDGGLVGGASLNADEFLRIMQFKKAS
jgi:triosephosphate isomerase (TIM)